MESKYDLIKEKLYKFSSYGVKISELTGATLIGNPTHLSSPYAYLNKLFVPLNDVELKELQNTLSIQIPRTYAYFLTSFSNGLKILGTTLCLDGLRKITGRGIEASYQPFDIHTTNGPERPKNAKESYFFIGGYDWDGSNLYIDTETERVHFCTRWDATSLYSWDSLENMLLSEIDRLYDLFTEDGLCIDEDKSTLPID